MQTKLSQVLKCITSFVLAIVLLSLSFSLIQGSYELTRLTPAVDMNDQDDYGTSFNEDGTKLAFHSISDLLGEGLSGKYVIWLYDTTTMAYTRVTNDDFDSWSPSLNGDGTRIAFVRNADIWLYDTTEMTITQLTATDSGRYSSSPSLSGDGTQVAFQSNSDFLNQGISSLSQFEIWLYDTKVMTFSRVTTATGSGNRSSSNPVISGNGNRIAFVSNADFLNEGLGEEASEIWLYDTTTLTFTRITTASDSTRYSYDPHLSQDGTKIVFCSTSELMGQSILPHQYEIWLYDTEGMTYTRVTTASDNDRDSYAPFITSDGTKIVFYSDSDLLNEGLADEQLEIWQYDVGAMTYTRLTTGSDVTRWSYNPIISSDGSKVAFGSTSDFLNQGIPDNYTALWLLNTPLTAIYLPVVLK